MGAGEGEVLHHLDRRLGVALRALAHPRIGHLRARSAPRGQDAHTQRRRQHLACSGAFRPQFVGLPVVRTADPKACSASRTRPMRYSLERRVGQGEASTASRRRGRDRRGGAVLHEAQPLHRDAPEMGVDPRHQLGCRGAATRARSGRSSRSRACRQRAGAASSPRRSPARRSRASPPSAAPPPGRGGGTRAASPRAAARRAAAGHRHVAGCRPSDLPP